MSKDSDSVRDVWFQLTNDEKFQFIQSNVRLVTAKGKIVDLQLADFQKKWLLDGHSGDKVRHSVKKVTLHY